MKKNTSINTYTMLVMRYMSPVVPLEDVVEDYLSHMSLEIAKRKAMRQELPFPVLRLGEKQKASWMVNLHDLAMYIDQQSALAKHDYKAMNGEQYAH
ncbi:MULTISPECIES: pyocin activator PrtN family protein [Acinetobacter]|uniref:pyocin activator PrtN family protein n=1 Tax=Acinetobacter TaxID=469 RepID=UPI0015D0E18F|nr:MULTISPECIES: pyocin activator PrtN family protein [Acinetobacter]MDM1274047.1 pyocin activator PrtN family protein [Acinetobacter indicus]